MSNKARLKKKKPGSNLRGKNQVSAKQSTVLSQTINTAHHFHQAGNFRQAEEYYRQVLAVDPINPSANNLLGLLYYQSGHIAAALPLIEKAIQAKPDYVEAYNTLGSIHHAAGHYEKAINCYRKALTYKPDFAMAYNNLGIVLEATGQYQAALDSYQKALDLQPRYADAHANQGIVFLVMGRIDDAIASYSRALILKPDFPDGCRNFSLLMKSRKTLPASVGSPNDRKNILINCLVRNDVESQGFFQACLHELFREDILEEVHNFLSSRESSDSFLNFIRDSRLSHLLSEQLFLLMLRKTVVADRLAETLLTGLRRGFAMLLATNEMDEQFYGRMTPVVSAIAQQCFWNEYAYQTTEAEAEYLSEIRGQLLADMSLTTPKSVICLALLACYAPLDTYNLDENFLVNSPTSGAISELIKIHFVETRKERELLDRIQSFSEVTDEISQKVKQQYEENPYPRWTGISLAPPRPFVEKLMQDIAPNSPANLRIIERPEVLIAGCGTGIQAISCAATYLNSSVVAIDLSRASLAYAKRKADELMITNLEFIQGDILELPKLDNTFDIVECTGVLHHMNDPEEGFRVLVNMLSPSGYMKIGLYSELARQHIVAAREFVRNHGFAPTVEGIRECRQALFALPDDDVAKLVTLGKDFYASSTVRDLIFHVQEHRFTLPEISRLLVEHNLEFMGFDLSAEIKNAYLAGHGDDPGAISLEYWHRYETEHPEIFFGMYNFWVRKK